ncbi:hypothetical protein [uncultured Hymenobacter sp.]|uniref:hypothetical protein n=1 Tax=uncultured Hymenobacter sp. TaxID=170016 RepID=UPI0035CBDDCD
MPKTIDYPRTSYQSAWEVSEVVDDTGGKCSLETCARKLNRKVSGSFKAILGSAVKFGLLTSKRELLTTTNLFRRIKHAYDKQEETLYHREAFLHPPLFTQICRKFRNRELPVHMFDIMLIREFGVEEINAQNVAKAFVEGARMTGIIDERNVIADIDQLAAQQGPRRELASGEMPLNLFKSSDKTRATPESESASTNSTNVAQPASDDLDSEFESNGSPGKSSIRPFVPAPPISRANAAPESDDSDPYLRCLDYTSQLKRQQLINHLSLSLRQRYIINQHLIPLRRRPLRRLYLHLPQNRQPMYLRHRQYLWLTRRGLQAS